MVCGVSELRVVCDRRSRCDDETRDLFNILKCGAFCVRYQTLPTRSKSSRQQNTEHGPQPARSNRTERLLGTDLARNRVKVTLALRCDPTPVRGKEGVSGRSSYMGGAPAKPSRPVQHALPSWLAEAAGCRASAELTRHELLSATPAAQPECQKLLPR